jgi:hypothetical protein
MRAGEGQWAEAYFFLAPTLRGFVYFFIRKKVKSV